MIVEHDVCGRLVRLSVIDGGFKLIFVRPDDVDSRLIDRHGKLSRDLIVAALLSAERHGQGVSSCVRNGLIDNVHVLAAHGEGDIVFPNDLFRFRGQLDRRTRISIVLRGHGDLDSLFQDHYFPTAQIELVIAAVAGITYLDVLQRVALFVGGGVIFLAYELDNVAASVAAQDVVRRYCEIAVVSALARIVERKRLVHGSDLSVAYCGRRYRLLRDGDGDHMLRNGGIVAVIVRVRHFYRLLARLNIARRADIFGSILSGDVLRLCAVSIFHGDRDHSALAQIAVNERLAAVSHARHLNGRNDELEGVSGLFRAISRACGRIDRRHGVCAGMFDGAFLQAFARRDGHFQSAAGDFCAVFTRHLQVIVLEVVGVVGGFKHIRQTALCLHVRFQADADGGGDIDRDLLRSLEHIVGVGGNHGQTAAFNLGAVRRALINLVAKQQHQRGHAVYRRQRLIRLCGQGDVCDAVAQSERCLVGIGAVCRPCSRLNAARDVKVDRVALVGDKGDSDRLGRNGKVLAYAAFIEHIVAHIRAARYRGGGGIAAAARVGVRLRAAHGDLQIVACNKPLRLAHDCGGRLRRAGIDQLGLRPRNAHGFALDLKLNGGVLFQLVIAVNECLNGGGVSLPFRIGVRLFARHGEGEAVAFHKIRSGGGRLMSRAVIFERGVRPRNVDGLGSYRILYLQRLADIVAIFDDFDNDAVI